MMGTNKPSLTKDQPSVNELMGNLIDEEIGEPLLLEVSRATETTFFKINLILTEVESKCHIALALAPSRTAIRLLDGDRIAVIDSYL
ncbi:hypothetical protein AVEN_203452-1 [Araneus ventricosus]|uniref:Uncharacterized protein n=1 Tax=Araneus ventricosus TaxID=182803 RepID=A0A4Y2BJ66_ARAVE|nr:hypothetical protein AVEN_203452-1 [Araneus ventricosus]